MVIYKRRHFLHLMLLKRNIFWLNVFLELFTFHWIWFLDQTANVDRMKIDSSPCAAVKPLTSYPHVPKIEKSDLDNAEISKGPTYCVAWKVRNTLTDWTAQLFHDRLGFHERKNENWLKIRADVRKNVASFGEKSRFMKIIVSLI